MDFTFAFNTTIIRFKLTDIYLYYVAQGFLPPPVPNVHNRGVVPDRVKRGGQAVHGQVGVNGQNSCVQSCDEKVLSMSKRNLLYFIRKDYIFTT